VRWDDVNVRARGVATHLIDQGVLARLALVRSWEQFAATARDAGYPVDPRVPQSPAQLDRIIGSVAAARLALLGRWLGPRRAVLQVVYEAEERHALRALLRGAVQGLSPDTRLRTVIPTPELPAPALAELARAESPAALAAGLLRYGHPAGRALQSAQAGDHGGALLGMELALARTFAARTVRAARKGGRILRAFAGWTIDLENTSTLMQAAGLDLPPSDLFLAGGRVLTLSRFTALAQSRDASVVQAGLDEVFAGTPYAAVFRHTDGALGMERRVLAAQIAWCKAMARLQPLGPAVVLGILLAIRAEAWDLRAAAWAVALEATAGLSVLAERT
jgi:vacuolar-type H+-ATPase subunit C/Vma6